MNNTSSSTRGRRREQYIGGYRPRRFLFLLIAVATAVWLGGRASQDSSRDYAIIREQQRIELPQSGELEVQAHAMPRVGNVIPVKVSITNLAPRSRRLRKPAVRGITDSGERVNELFLVDPAVAENGTELLRVVSNGQTALGAVVERMGGWWVAGSIGVQVLGAGFVAIGVAAAWEAAKSPQERLECYRLGGRILHEEGTTIGLNEGATDSLACGRNPGFVFLPNRNYTGLEVAVINTLTGNDEVLTVPWTNDPADQAVREATQ